MMRLTYEPPKVGSTMFESLLARGNGRKLVDIHRGRITKVTPITCDGDVCSGTKRPVDGARDNGAMFEKLFAEPFGQYYVVVCYGLIVEVSKVEKDAAVKVQDVEKKG